MLPLNDTSLQILQMTSRYCLQIRYEGLPCLLLDITRLYYSIDYYFNYLRLRYKSLLLKVIILMIILSFYWITCRFSCWCNSIQVWNTSRAEELGERMTPPDCCCVAPSQTDLIPTYNYAKETHHAARRPYWIDL